MCHEGLSAGCWRPWARTGLEPYLRIWEGFLEEVTSRDLKDEYELVMQRERGNTEGRTIGNSLARDFPRSSFQAGQSRPSGPRHSRDRP